MKLIAVLGLMSLLFAGCCHDLACSDTGLNVAFKGYTNAELDTVLILKYHTDFATGTPDDSVFDRAAIQAGDTAYIVDGTLLSGAKSYAIYLPKNGRTVTFDHFQFQQKSEQRCIGSSAPNKCYNPIVSYLVNGQASGAEEAFIVK